MIQLILCDDKQAHNATLKMMMEKVVRQHQVQARVALTASRKEEVLAFAQQHPVDSIYFLDICLNDAALDDPRGIALCKRVRALNPRAAIVYVSAYQQYALDCCQSHAFDFLVKPFSEEQLSACLLSAVQSINLREKGAPLWAVAGSRSLCIDEGDILYLEKRREYVAAHTLDGGETVWRETFAALAVTEENHAQRLISLRK